MNENASERNLNTSFEGVSKQLRGVAARNQIELVELPAPEDLALHAIAFAAHVHSPDANADQGVGRFVLLADTQPQESWASNYRVVIFAKSSLEADIASDAHADQVAWSWLIEALGKNNCSYGALAGTVTKVNSSGFGTLQDEQNHAEIEIRASWSPTSTDFKPHLNAWQDFILGLSGHSQLIEAVPANND